MLCIANTEGRFLRLNPAWTVTLGFTAADLMKGRFIEFVHPDDVNPTMEAMAQLANQEMVADFVNRFRCKNGTYRWLEWRSQPFGSLIYAVARDITERRQAEQALRESEGRYRTLFESTRDALMTLSPPDWKFTSANPAIAEMFGARDIRDFIALAPWELSPERQPDGQLSNEKAREMIDIAVKDGYNFFEWTHRRINGEVFPATVLLSRLDINNELILQATVRDVSDQKRAEAERERLEARMRHAEKMEAVGQLAGGIAHDFNNQLMGIMGYAELLINRLDNPTLREDADSILRASRRAADLTRDLLAFSRKGKYLTVPVNVHKVIEESVTMLERSIDKRIEIRRELKASPAMITGDPTQMQNALLNLAINARDALPNGGTITFTTETVDMKTVFAKADRHKAVKGRYLKICVIDNGKGMDEETMKHIFEPFFTTKEPGKGTGMGLASVYGTVKSHHGVVDAKSTLGEGSEFSMCFPLLEIHDDSAAGDTRPVPARREATILLVDDDEIVRNLVSSMLRALGHKVVACKDGAEAVDLYRQSWPDIDIVLLDMVMPRMNGRDAFFAMRALNKEMKAILISGFSIDGEAQSLLDAGMKKFIQKPFSMRELSVTIDEVISSAPRPGPC
jgi:PAS domain S-box-containing protein